MAHKRKNYFPIYERHFARFCDLDVTLIEIGCGEGGSLQMWKRFFGPHARIIGVDNRPECLVFEEDQIVIRIGDQADAAFLQSIADEFGAPDIVIDDGSHQMTDMAASFSTLYPPVSKNGVYLVEDVHTAYREEFGGGLRHPQSFIERCKHLIDLLNADHSRGALTPNDFTETTLSINFYDGVVVFEKGRFRQKFTIKSGGGLERPQYTNKINR